MHVNTVGYTSQITAGFRAVELSHNPQPILVDHLAQHLAGDALQTALADFQKLQQAQGTGHSLRVPARNRVMDDFLLEGLQQLQHLQEHQGSDAVVQVVNIGCGMVSAQRQLHAATLTTVAST
jgi:O-methyltransferase involved in polyketide biosynthesis